MKKKFLKNVEWTVLFCVLVLFTIGLVALRSATKSTEYVEFYKQVQWFVISVPFLVIFTVVDYEKIADLSPIYYIISIVLLIAVLFTKPISGASSWFNFGFLSFQPAEISKIFVIIFISKMIASLQLKGKNEINRIYKLLVPVLFMAVPTVLIAIQPDYGTAIAYVVAFAFIILIAGLGRGYVFTMLALLVSSSYFLITKILPVKAPHAIKRIEVFLNPGIDPRGAGYNVIQSRLAIGSGQVFGMGFGQGNQTQMGYLHPKTTDFIFSLISEEFGFVVSAIVIILYVFLIVKAIYISRTAKDNLGSYIAIGIAGILTYHMVENIAMTMGLLPITGIPLPFVSYGGSSLITNFMFIGMLLNISGRRQKSIYVDVT